MTCSASPPRLGRGGPSNAGGSSRSSIRSRCILDRKSAAHVEHTQVGMKHSCSAGSPSPKRIQPVAMWSWKRSRGRLVIHLVVHHSKTADTHSEDLSKLFNPVFDPQIPV